MWIPRVRRLFEAGRVLEEIRYVISLKLHGYRLTDSRKLWEYILLSFQQEDN